MIWTATAKPRWPSKTADGTDGLGRSGHRPERQGLAYAQGRRPNGRRILDGPEYFTIFDGQTGAALKTVDYHTQPLPD